MRFTDYDIDIPEKLIKALYKGELVIFVGAGISYKTYPLQKPDTYYPLFSGLCDQIKTELEIEMTQDEQKLYMQGLFDRVLGNWEYSKKKVREKAVDILTRNEEKQRLIKHHAIIDLFPNGLKPRVVTTNFDNLLTNALKERGLIAKSKWKIYIAPALPPGRRFEGLCYLHGSVKEPDEMILTDRDVGKAYMDEGWALKFAHEIFKEFAVLFIGYSLNDPPLRYLSLALAGSMTKNDEKKINKWALVSASDNCKEQKLDWYRRGVEPIFYPAKDDDHQSLEKDLIAWAEYNKRGFIDRKNELYEFAKGDPNGLLPHQNDKVKDYLKDKNLLREFAKVDFNDGWFDKLMEWGHLAFILKNNGDSKEADFGLSKWIISRIISDHISWILKLKNYRNSLNSILLDTFCREFQKNKEIDLEPKVLVMILEFFRPIIQKNESDRYSHNLDRIFEILVNSDLIEDAVWLISSIIDVKLRFKEHFSYFMAKIEGNEDVDLRLDCDLSFGGMITHHICKKYIEKYFLPKIKTTGKELLIGLTNKFHDIQKSVCRIKQFQYTYILRPSITPNPNKNISLPLENFFIDNFIVIWEKLMEVSLEQASKIYFMWKEIENPFFERISTYCLTKLLESGYVE